MSSRPGGAGASYAPLGVAVGVFVGLVLLLLLVGGLGAKSPPNEHREPATDGRGEVSIGVSWSGWFEKFDTCVITPHTPGAELPNCYREPVVRESFIKQPLSVIAAAAFSLVGFAILFWTARQPTTSPFSPFYRVWFGFVALAMGPGSMIFHASLSSLGGLLDQVSMYMLLAFLLSYTSLRFLPIERRAELWFAVMYFVLLTAFGVLGLVTIGESSLLVFAATAIAIGLIDGAFALYLSLGNGRYTRRGLRWLLAFGVLASAFIPWWIASNPDLVKADPTGFPFHALWHLFAAGFVLAYFWYLKSEERRPSKTRSN
ncbi:MAG: ceramidase [Actinomycetota bacterium]|nr:ceramidase [Actinomycetota bacterium]